MQKIKISCVFAGIGFLISFVFGLFSGSGIGIVLLRAVLFTLIFAALGLGISFIYEKFLADDSGDISSNSLDGNSNNKEAVHKGQLVDVTIQDEELPSGESSNRFVVNNNHQMLNKNDTNQSAPVESESVKTDTNASENTGFVPLKNFETVNNFSSTEAVSSTVAGEKASSRPSSVEGELDVLPDMENMNFGSNESESTGSSVVGYEDSVNDFSSSSTRHKTLEDVGIQDAALMAKAISTALSNEES